MFFYSCLRAPKIIVNLLGFARTRTKSCQWLLLNLWNCYLPLSLFIVLGPLGISSCYSALSPCASEQLWLPFCSDMHSFFFFKALGFRVLIGKIKRQCLSTLRVHITVVLCRLWTKPGSRGTVSVPTGVSREAVLGILFCTPLPHHIFTFLQLRLLHSEYIQLTRWC